MSTFSFLSRIHVFSENFTVEKGKKLFAHSDDEYSFKQNEKKTVMAFVLYSLHYLSAFFCVKRQCLCWMGSIYGCCFHIFYMIEKMFVAFKTCMFVAVNFGRKIKWNKQRKLQKKRLNILYFGCECCIAMCWACKNKVTKTKKENHSGWMCHCNFGIQRMSILAKSFFFRWFRRMIFLTRPSPLPWSLCDP